MERKFNFSFIVLSQFSLDFNIYFHYTHLCEISRIKDFLSYAQLEKRCQNVQAKSFNNFNNYISYGKNFKLGITPFCQKI